jgi:hypothetical protein
LSDAIRSVTCDDADFRNKTTSDENTPGSLLLIRRFGGDSHGEPTYVLVISHSASSPALLVVHYLVPRICRQL